MTDLVAGVFGRLLFLRYFFQFCWGMEKVKDDKNGDEQPIAAEKMAEIEREKAEKLLYLIAEIIVNASFREHEKKGN